MKLKELEAVCNYIDEIRIHNKKIHAVLPLARHNLRRDLITYQNCIVVMIEPRIKTGEISHVDMSFNVKPYISVIIEEEE